MMEDFNILDHIDDTESFINEWYDFHVAVVDSSIPIEFLLVEVD